MSANGFRTGEEMEAARMQTVDYFVEQYRSILEENLADYIRNFEKYMRADMA